MGLGGVGGTGKVAQESEEKADGRIWSEEPDGSITTKKSDAALFLPLELPDKFEVEFEVSSTKPLSFLMVFGHDSKYGLRIATWVDVLVAAEGKAFRTLKTIGEKDRSIHLYVFVDQTAHTMQVFSDTGDKLGEVVVKGAKVDGTGLMFRNGDFDLAIRRLRCVIGTAKLRESFPVRIPVSN